MFLSEWLETQEPEEMPPITHLERSIYAQAFVQGYASSSGESLCTAIPSAARDRHSVVIHDVKNNRKSKRIMLAGFAQGSEIRTALLAQLKNRRWWEADDV